MDFHRPSIVIKYRGILGAHSYIFDMSLFLAH